MRVKDRTWYEATAERGPVRPSLSGAVEAEVCVVGGGLAGLTAALELARRRKRVVLLEAERFSWAASGRNGGFVSNGFAEGLDEIAARVGVEGAKALFELSRFGNEYVRRAIMENDPSIKMGDGWMVARRYESGAALAATRDRLERVYGDVRQVLSIEETRARLHSTRYFQSLLDPSGFHMHPLRYALMLAQTAEKAGATLCEHSPALEVSGSAGKWTVKCAGGEARVGQVVHTVASLDRRIHGATGRAILPVATYVAVTEPLKQEAIRTSSAASDSRRAGNYFRLIDKGRILWGGAITTKTEEPSRLAERMKRDMLSVFPQLGNPHLDYAWAGLMAYALHRMPLIGGDGEGQWWATGFGGHGMNTTAMAGILLARAIADSDDEYRRFAPFGPQWAGGPFGRAGVQGSYWWMQIRDRIDEASARKG